MARWAQQHSCHFPGPHRSGPVGATALRSSSSPSAGRASPARGGGAPSRVGRARPLCSRTLARFVSQPSSRQRGVDSPSSFSTSRRTCLSPATKRPLDHSSWPANTRSQRTPFSAKGEAPGPLGKGEALIFGWCAAPRLSTRRAAPRLSARRVRDRCSSFPAATRAVAQDYTAGLPSRKETGA